MLGGEPHAAPLEQLALGARPRLLGVQQQPVVVEDDRVEAAAVGARVHAPWLDPTSAPRASRAQHEPLHLARLGDAHPQHGAHVDVAADRRGGADRRDLRRQRAAEQPVEQEPHDPGDAGEDRRGDRDARRDHRRLAALEAAVEPRPQPPQLQRGHHRVRGEGADHEAGDPERLVEADGDDDVDDDVHRGEAGRDPRPLEREEGPRQQQVEAAEGQAEREPEQRDRGRVRRARR